MSFCSARQFSNPGPNFALIVPALAHRQLLEKLVSLARAPTPEKAANLSTLIRDVVARQQAEATTLTTTTAAAAATRLGVPSLGPNGSGPPSRGPPSARPAPGEKADMLAELDVE